MSKITSPPEKKRLSLELDRRNTYGENDKSSRKNIPKSRARVHRNERRMVEQMLSHGHVTAPNDEAVAIESNVKAKTRSKKLVGFKKCADTALGVTVAKKIARRKRVASKA
jgi:hypothetical protein